MRPPLYWLTVSFAVLLFFEYIITLDREIEMFWRRKSSGATALFLANRYTILANAILVPEHLAIGLAGTDEVSLPSVSLGAFN